MQHLEDIRTAQTYFARLRLQRQNRERMHGAILPQRSPLNAADAAGASSAETGHAGLHVGAGVAAQFPAGLPRNPLDGPQSSRRITRHDAVGTDGMDYIERGQVHHHASVRRDALARVAGTGSAQGQGNPPLVGEADNSHHFGPRGGLNHDFSQLVGQISLEDGRVPVEVAAQGFESFGSGDDALGRKEFGQGVEVSGGHASVWGVMQ